MNRIAVMAALVLALSPVPLAAQGDAEARIQAAQSRVAAAGVPSALLASHVAQGRAKGVPMERIAAAVERRAQALISARQAMARAAGGLSAADLNAGADAVEAGVTGGALRAVIERSRAEDRPVAIAVLTYLREERGMSENEALSRVTRALEEGPDALRTLPARANAEARGKGKGPPAGRGGGKAGRPGNAGPPQGLPTPGKKPGSGKPDGVGKGKPDNPGKGKPGGRPGG